MKYLCVLSREHLDLAVFEACEVLSARSHLLDGHYLIIEAPYSRRYKRLAYAKEVYQLWFSVLDSQLESAVSSFPIGRYTQGGFFIRGDRSIASIVWKNLRSPVVSSTGTIIGCFRGRKVHVGKLLWENSNNFESRKAHRNPALHPTGCHPKLARCMVNLLGARLGSGVLDPFCGAGGVLIEAGLLDYDVHGWDIDSRLIEKARQNLNHYDLRAELVCADSRVARIDQRFVVADLPYGRNTADTNVPLLFGAFMRNAKRCGVQKLVLGLPYRLTRKSIHGYRIILQYPYYIHKSLSKYIVMFHHLN